MKFTISAPGKIILMGEHAVVYGKPAIVAAVNRRIMATFDDKNQTCEMKVKSSIPIRVGMGSSAALSVILAASHVFLSRGRSKLSAKTLSTINKTAYEYEKIYHGNASGVDTTVITHGGILWFRKITDGKFAFKKLNIGGLRKFVLINTGKPKETTREMVEKVKIERKKERKKIDSLFKAIEQQTQIFWRALETKNRQLTVDSIQNSESFLEDLGLVSPLAKKVVREIEEIGGAAKISGAGGLTGGSGILLCYHQNPQRIIDLAKKLKLESFRVKLGEEGLRIDE